MKKLLLSALLLCGVSAYSQGWKYGIEAGYTSNKFRTDLLDQRARNGFKIGGVVNYTFKNDVVVEAGASYETRSGTRDKKEINNTISFERMSEVETVHTDYLNIPLSVGYKMKIGENTTFTPYAGWFLNIGVSGSGEYTGVDAFGQQFGMGIDLFSAPEAKNKPFNKLDTGPTLGMSLQYYKVRLKCYYEVGIHSGHSSYNRKYNDNTLGVSLAYLF